MAITLTTVYSNHDGVDRTSYTTGSITPAANRPLYLFVTQQGTSNVPTVSCTTGHTFTQRASIAQGARCMTLFSAPGIASPSTGTITADYGGVTQTACNFSLVDGQGIDTATADGIVQSATGSAGTGTSLSVTLAAFGSGTNATLVAIGHTANEVSSPGTGLGTLSDVHGAGPSEDVWTGWQATSNTTPGASWATNTVNYGIGLELKESTGGGGSVAQYLPLLGVGS